MLKTLLIATSALALTAGVASAQVVPLGTPDSVSAVTITNQSSPPITSGEETTLRDAMLARSRAGTNAAFSSPGRVGRFYIDQVAGEPDVQDLSAAGNKAAIDVDGNDNVHTVDQQGGTNGWAAVRQTGNDANADIDQNGISGAASTDNAALIQQISGTTGGVGQRAEINQTEDDPNGGLNTAAILQGGIDGGGAGRSNSARIDQQGTLNEASVVQGARAAAGAQNNTATVIQRRAGTTANGQSNNNVAGIQQKANGNALILQQNSVSTAYITQVDGDNLDSDIIQEGFDNFASNFQDLSSGTADSFINQLGGGNSAFVDQSGSLTNGVSELFQSGDFNSALVTQTAAATATSRVSQTGNNNVGTVRQ